MLATALAAEAGRRILTPREPVRAPQPVDIRDHFSEAEIARGRAFSRPQRRLACARSLLGTALLVELARRPPAALTHRGGGSARQTALAAGALSLALAVPGLPLRALARRRAIAVGLDTQSWGGWGSDLAKAALIETGFSAALGAGVHALSTRHGERWWR